MPSRLSFRTAALVLGLLAGAVAGHGTVSADRAGQAEAHYRRAADYEARGTIETRRLAMESLERATALAPERVEYQLALGRLYYRMGFLKQAKARFRRGRERLSLD